MNIAWGLIVVALALLAWAGQAISWLTPDLAVRYSLREADESVEPAYAADIRGEALWDTLTLWTMVVAGVLLIIDAEAWTYFGLVGGGMYLYFAGRGIFTRRQLRREGFRVGDEASVRLGYVFLWVWGVMALITVVAAARTLGGGS